ncbi:MAG TPA: YcnI family protein [Polyangiaceae bacterium]|nr:YcnI family protein [Polyangiaceae bacterium]
MDISRRLFRFSLAGFIGFIALAGLTPSTAQAHVSISSGPAFANTTQEVTFGVGHGCAGADTVSVQVEIPPGVGSVRPHDSGFGQVDVETDAAGAVVAVTWQKADGRVLDADTNYYKLLLRLKVPDQPFSTLYFPSHQTCRAKDGTTTVVDWVGMDESDSSGVEPAPALRILPARFPGWNKFTMPGPLTDLAPFFADAQIVWRGNAAYAKSPTTTELIATTSGVISLSTLEAGDQIWVKY